MISLIQFTMQIHYLIYGNLKKKRKKKEYYQCIRAVVLRLTSEFAFFRHIIRNSPQPDAESVHKLDFTSFDLDGKSWCLYSNLANSCVSLFDILRENSY